MGFDERSRDYALGPLCCARHLWHSSAGQSPLSRQCDDDALFRAAGATRSTARRWPRSLAHQNAARRSPPFPMLVVLPATRDGTDLLELAHDASSSTRAGDRRRRRRPSVYFLVMLE